MSAIEASYERSPSAVACPLGEGVAVLNTENNQYYSLNVVGAFVWNALETPGRPAELCALISRQFTVDEDRCRTDLEALLADLEKEGLIERRAG